MAAGLTVNGKIYLNFPFPFACSAATAVQVVDENAYASAVISIRSVSTTQIYISVEGGKSAHVNCIVFGMKVKQ